MKVRLLYANTHAGQSLFQGGLKWAVGEYDPDLVVVVEVGRLRAKLALRRLFPVKQWSIAGLKPIPVPGWVGSGTHVVARRSKLKKKWEGNRLMTRQRWVGKARDKWHPVRRLTRGFYAFAADSRIAIHVGADHAWTHAGYPLHGTRDVPTEYRNQVRAYAEEAGRSVRQGVAVIDVGDMNAMHSDGDFVKDTFGAQRMHVLYRQRLDYLLGNGRVKLVGVTRIPMGPLKTDHDGFVVDLEISEVF